MAHEYKYKLADLEGETSPGYLALAERVERLAELLDSVIIPAGVVGEDRTPDRNATPAMVRTASWNR